MTLTELWKDGQLEDGFYYFRLPDGSIDIASEYRLIRYRLTKDADKIEVLAPVPSYEEWQELKEAGDGLSKLMFKSLMNRFVKADEEREKFAEENQQLKELLKECRDDVYNYQYICLGTLTKIDNAIGEKK